MRNILLALLMAVPLLAQYPVNGGLGGGGGGFTAPSGYSATVTGLTTLTVTAAQHGQGPKPWSKCFDNSVPAVEVACNDSVSPIGDVVFTWAPAFTGEIQIRGPGASAGAAGDFVGPASSTSGNLVSFSGTSGKIGADSGIAATTVVKGAAALSTAGAVPYVVSAGVLGQAPTGLFYDAANVRLGILTNAPTVPVQVGSGSLPTAWPGFGVVSVSGQERGFAVGQDTTHGAVLSWGYNATANSAIAYLKTFGGSNLLAIQSDGGNVSLGGIVNGNYKFDVQASGSAGLARFFNQSVGGSTLVVVQAGDTQSGNLLSVRNNGGTQIAGMDAFGALTLSSYLLVGQSSDLGWSGRGVFQASADGVFVAKNNAQTDFNRFCFGGITSSFPCLKRSAATLQVRLADDSAFATLDMGIPKFSGTNSTGAGSALLGTNSPASTLTAPYTWITVVTSDGSTAYIPVWK